MHVEQFVDARRGQPLWLRATNRAGTLFPRFATPSADDWWEEARRREPDTPDPTPEARAALAALVDSIGRDMRLTFVGRYSARDDTTRMARTHLRIERALRRDPTVLETPLPDPIFVVGWPRTGTTALHQLLARDPAHRTIPYWESFDPVPPETGPDRRIERLDAMLGQLSRMAPSYDAIHPMEAEMPEECVALFMNDFRTLQYDFQYRAPGYVAWLLAEDPGIAYRGYLRQLRLVQHHRPTGRRLVLKDPTHLVHLATVLELFPAARVIFTHRDPGTAISSLCSLHAYTRALFTDQVDPRALGREVMEGHWPRARDSADRIRADLPAGRFADVRHTDLVRDPIATVARAYADLGLHLTAEARAAMQRYVDREARAPRHRHVHSPEGFGLRREQIRERFADYCRRFDL